MLGDLVIRFVLGGRRRARRGRREHRAGGVRRNRVRLSGTLAAWLVLLIAAIVWLGLSIAVWLLARRLKGDNRS